MLAAAGFASLHIAVTNVRQERTMRLIGTRNGGCLAAFFVALVLCLAGAGRAGAAIWSIQRAPARAGAIATVLAGVSCTSPEACVAVGGPDDEPGVMLAEKWDGGRWTIQPTRTPAGSIQSFLDGVSCLSISDCLAVGYAVDRRGVVTALSLRWDGSSWSQRRIPRPARSIATLLAGISCTSQSMCTAVGSAENRAAVWFTLVERWNGSHWTIQRTPRVPYGQLAGVSCGSARACTAVGLDVGGELVEHWNGTTWRRDRSHEIVTGDTELNAISCAAPTACAAGGAAVIPSTIIWPLLQSWSSGRWSVRPMPGQPPGMVYGVSCTSRTACVAVGSDSLVEERRGDRWSIDLAPGPEQANLYAVSCAGRTCMAVGSLIDPRGREVPLAESIIDSR